MHQTSDAKDLAFLDKLIQSEAQYSRSPERDDGGDGGTSNSAYDHIEDDSLYIKLDSGIVRGRDMFFYDADDVARLVDWE